MNSYVIISYVVCLIIIFICILSVRIAAYKKDHLKTARYLIRAIGVLPGFLGVLIGIYIQIILKNTAGLAIMSGWLILELASVQLLDITKRIEKDSLGNSEPV